MLDNTQSKDAELHELTDNVLGCFFRERDLASFCLAAILSKDDFVLKTGLKKLMIIIVLNLTSIMRVSLKSIDSSVLSHFVSF